MFNNRRRGLALRLGDVPTYKQSTKRKKRFKINNGIAACTIKLDVILQTVAKQKMFVESVGEVALNPTLLSPVGNTKSFKKIHPEEEVSVMLVISLH